MFVLLKRRHGVHWKKEGELLMKVVVIEGNAAEVAEVLKRIGACNGQSSSAPSLMPTPKISFPLNDKSAVEEFFREFRRQNGGS